MPLHASRSPKGHEEKTLQRGSTTLNSVKTWVLSRHRCCRRAVHNDVASHRQASTSAGGLCCFFCYPGREAGTVVAIRISTVSPRSEGRSGQVQRSADLRWEAANASEIRLARGMSCGYSSTTAQLHSARCRNLRCYRTRRINAEGVMSESGPLARFEAAWQEHCRTTPSDIDPFVVDNEVSFCQTSHLYA